MNAHKKRLVNHLQIIIKLFPVYPFGVGEYLHQILGGGLCED